MQTTAVFLYGIHIRRVAGISVAFRSILTCEDSLQPPGGQEERLSSLQVQPSAPPPNETSETGLFLPRPLSPPLLFFTPMFVGVLIKVLVFSKVCNKLAAPERCIGHSVFILSAQNWGGASCSLRSV